MGASVSVGFGGTPFGDAFAAAAPRSTVTSHADLFFFRDPFGNSTAQIDAAIADAPTTLVAIDFLFWDIYAQRDPAWRDRALASGLANLERARIAGAWIVVGDVPRVTTASELLLPPENVPDVATLARFNRESTRWASERERVLLVPFASWAEPLAANGDVAISSTEIVPAASLVAADGLHANALGVWFLLDTLDHLIEQRLPGTPKDALVFERPR